MATDPYEILGVGRKASQDDIRKAYRKLAKAHHPDLNPGNQGAADRFKEVTAAYDLLSDADKRARFDRGEIDASGAERPQHQFYRDFAETPGGFRYRATTGAGDAAAGDFGDIFSEIFGGFGGRRAGGRRQGADARYGLEVDFLDAVNGARRRITLPDGQVLDVTVPAGVDDGQVLRLKGKGAPGPGSGPPGDALIEVRVKPHPQFQRQGDDIAVEVPVALHEAVLGAKIEVPTPTGRVTMTIPAGASSGQVLRLKGKGIANTMTGRTGDQLVTLKLVMPKTIDADLKGFMRQWGEAHAYDPRRTG